MFLAKHGVSKYYSPRMIVCQENMDYKNHLKINFGTYVLANNEPNPTNTNATRRLDCIYRRVTYSAQGGHGLLHLQTNSVITRNCVTPALITHTIINQLHYIADMEGTHSGIKFSNRTGIILYDSAWIAEMDYSEGGNNENEFENKSENEEDDDTESSDNLTLTLTITLTEDEYLVDDVDPN